MSHARFQITDQLTQELRGVLNQAENRVAPFAYPTPELAAGMAVVEDKLRRASAKLAGGGPWAPRHRDPERFAVGGFAPRFVAGDFRCEPRLSSLGALRAYASVPPLVASAGNLWMGLAVLLLAVQIGSSGAFAACGTDNGTFREVSAHAGLAGEKSLKSARNGFLPGNDFSVHTGVGSSMRRRRGSVEARRYW